MFIVPRLGLLHSVAFFGMLLTSEPWQGDRWSITGYTCLGLDTFSDNDLSWLRSMGFPLPVRDCEDPLVKTVHSDLHAQTAISVAASVVEPELMWTPLHLRHLLVACWLMRRKEVH